MNEQERAVVAATKAKYPDNPWWDSPDPRVRAYWQLHEDTLVLEWNAFASDVKVLLGRPVWTHEYGLRIAQLRAEAEAAFHGASYSEERKQQAINDGMEALIATGKVIIGVEVPDEEA